MTLTMSVWGKKTIRPPGGCAAWFISLHNGEHETSWFRVTAEDYATLSVGDEVEVEVRRVER